MRISKGIDSLELIAFHNGLWWHTLENHSSAVITSRAGERFNASFFKSLDNWDFQENYYYVLVDAFTSPPDSNFLL